MEALGSSGSHGILGSSTMLKGVRGPVVEDGALGDLMVEIPVIRFYTTVESTSHCHLKAYVVSWVPWSHPLSD